MPGTEDEFGEITVYLKRLSAGDASAEEPLAEAVYAQLRRISRGLMHSQSRDISLQPTALVNAVLIELVRIRSINWEDRVHFFRVAAKLLRHRLIDDIRHRQKSSSIPAKQRVDLDTAILPREDRLDEILFVHEGLERLAKFDRQLAELIEMVYFGGVTIAMAAEIRGVSEKTIDRHLELGRRWLRNQMAGPCPSFASGSASFDRP